MAARKKRSQRINPDNKLKNPLITLVGFFIHRTMKKLFVATSLILTIGACKKENSKLTPACDGSHPTYNSEIKSIIDTRCATSGCHPGFSSYSGLNGILQNGQFKREVLTNQSMPQNSSLTQDQINKIQCWVNDGYPEN